MGADSSRTYTELLLERRTRLWEVMETQCSEGNWNYDPYMHGIANGLILALSIMKGEEPAFLEAPKQWLMDRIEAKE